VTANELDQKTRSVGMRNDDPEFDCQHWLSDALKKLGRDGWLTSAQVEEGVNGMLEATLEAADEYGAAMQKRDRFLFMADMLYSERKPM
jgi:hypothetical protein